MTTRSARKGDHFEGQCIVPYLRDEFGPHISRPRAGALRDLGDVAGIPAWTLQLKAYTDLMRAIREGLPELAEQMTNAATPYGGLIVKRVGKTDPARQLFVAELGTAIPFIRETARWETRGAA